MADTVLTVFIVHVSDAKYRQPKQRTASLFHSFNFIIQNKRCRPLTTFSPGHAPPGLRGKCRHLLPDRRSSSSLMHLLL